MSAVSDVHLVNVNVELFNTYFGGGNLNTTYSTLVYIVLSRLIYKDFMVTFCQFKDFLLFLFHIIMNPTAL